MKISKLIKSLVDARNEFGEIEVKLITKPITILTRQEIGWVDVLNDSFDDNKKVFVIKCGKEI